MGFNNLNHQNKLSVYIKYKFKELSIMFNSIEEALKDIKEGKMIIIVDDEEEKMKGI